MNNRVIASCNASQLARWASIAVAAIGVGDALAQETQLSPASECALAAARWWSGAPGLDVDKIDGASAVMKCTTAVEDRPDDGDSWAHLARALAKEQRYDDALKAIDRSVELGSAAGLWQKGVAYHYGYSVSFDEEVILEAYRAAAEQEYPPAMHNLGIVHSGDEPGFHADKRDLELAFSYFDKAVDYGYTPSLTALAWFYATGEGVAQDWNKSLTLNELAASHGYPVSAHRAALIHAQGLAGPADHERALTLWKAAVAEGDYDLKSIAYKEAARHLGTQASGLLDDGLRDEDRFIRMLNMLLVGAVGDDRHQPTLIEMIDDTQIRTDILGYALVETGSDSALEALAQLYPESEGIVRQRIVTTLVSFDPSRTRKVIEPALDDPDFYVVIAAMAVIGHHYNEIPVQKIRRFLSNDYPDDVIEGAAELIGAAGDRTSAATIRELLRSPEGRPRRSVIEALGNLQDEESVDALIELLADDYPIGDEAARALGQIGDPHAVRPLIKNLFDEEGFERLDYIIALGEIGDPRAIGVLTRIAQDEESLSRDSAIDALYQIGTDKAVRAARRLGYDWQDESTFDERAKLKSPDDLERWSAANHLQFEYDPDAVPDLVRLLNDPDPGVRRIAVKAIVHQLDAEAEELILPLVTDDDELMRSTVLNELNRIGGERTVHTLYDLAVVEGYDFSNYWLMQRIDPTLTVNLAVQGLYSDNTDERLAAAELIDRYTNPMIMSRLLELADSEPVAVANAAVRALGRYDDPIIFDAFSRHLQKPHVDEDTRIAIAWGLTRTRNPDAVPHLRLLLDDESDDVREAAIYSSERQCFDELTDDVLANVTDRKQSDDVRKGALWYLAKCAPDVLYPFLDRHYSELSAAQKSQLFVTAAIDKHVQASRFVDEALADDSSDVRAGAVRYLRETGSNSDVDLISGALVDESDDVRLEAIQARVALTSDDPSTLLATYVNDDEHEIADFALKTLLELAAAGELAAEPQIIEQLFKVIDNNEAHFIDHHTAAKILWSFSDVHVDNKFLDRIVRGGWELDARYAITGNFDPAHSSLGVREVLDWYEKSVSNTVIDSANGLLNRASSPTIRDSLSYALYEPRDNLAELLLKIDIFNDEVRRAFGTEAWSQYARAAVESAPAYGRGMLRQIASNTEGEASPSFYEHLWWWADARATASAGDLAHELQVLDEFRSRFGAYPRVIIAYLYGAKLHAENGRYAAARSWLQPVVDAEADLDLYARLWLHWLLAEIAIQANDVAESEKQGALVRSVVDQMTFVEFRELDLPVRSYSHALRALIAFRAGHNEAATNLVAQAESTMAYENRTMYIESGALESVSVMTQSIAVGMRVDAAIEEVTEAAAQATDVQNMWGEVPVKNHVHRAIELELLESSIQLNLALAAVGNSAALETAAATAEQLKLMSQSAPDGIRPADPAVRKAYDELSGRLSDIARLDEQIRLSIQDDSNKDSASESPRKLLQELQRKRNEEHAALKAFVVQLKTDHPELSSLVADEPAALPDIYAHLEPGQTLIEYVLLDDSGWALVYSQSTAQFVRLPAGRQVIEPKVSQFVRQLVREGRYRGPEAVLTVGVEEPPDAADLAAELAQMLLTPVSSHIKQAGHVTIVPNGALHQLPFAALPFEGSPLTLSVTLNVLTNKSDLTVIGSRSSSHQGSLVVGNPSPPAPQWRPLPGAEEEAIAIASTYLATDAVVGDEASRDTLVGQDLRNNVIHLALHGEAVDMERTRLVFSDGYVKVREVWELAIQGAPLVVLSACETALGDQLPGDEVVSLTNGFIFAGARSVISTLWRVDDESTKELMLVFYANRSLGESKALAAAQEEMIRRGYSAYHWAGFVLHGSP